ncbi:hypothetical protein Psi02_29700 [Planotetraspora silvatica]|uniref:KAP NTPase domain-containing protein n=1 Tax=Planotetraspora silvatica TaxID=234614 RepID=A0A8J3UNN7_9ACTN|nr:hypothetical protein [Planotetraspora silvatica]GII46546.1 hypothetical protein Psi02_29700 [Planotetraspora silvatica]
MDIGDPLNADAILYDQYMAAVGETLRDPEIRDAFDYVWVTPGQVRAAMIRDAATVLAATPREWAEYRRSREHIAARVVTVADGIRDALKEDERDVQLAKRALVAGVIGLATVVAGLFGGIWSGLSLLIWPGLVITVISGLAFAGSRLLGGEGAHRYLERIHAWALPVVTTWVSEFEGSSSPRNVLIAALKEHELAAQVRLRINALRRDHLSNSFTVYASPGLSEVFDSSYHVPTAVARELDALLSRVSGASIGIAGPRGAGKSTLIRRFCEDPQGSHERGDLRCLVSAPVEYAPRDFVLHLFATFCRRTLRYLRLPDASQMRRRSRVVGHVLRVIGYGAIAWTIMRWPDFFGDLLDGFNAFVMALTGRDWVASGADALRRIGLSANLVAAGVMVAGAGHILVLLYLRHTRWRAASGVEQALARRARRYLVQIRYLQTHTSGWSGTLKLPIGLDGQRTMGLSRVEQPLSYPEIVATFRAFADDVAEFLQPDHRLFIGIDELDKMGSGQEAERFLNDIKGVLGLSRIHFMVSVSDDAMNAFERRGLPFRDAFDSSFDEIIQVGPLAYEESLRLLYRRVVGLTEPYVAFCHCLSGGLPRDLIRAARRVVRNGHDLSEAATLARICSAIIREDLMHKAKAIMALSAAHSIKPDMLDLLHGLSRNEAPGISAPEVLKIALSCASDDSALDFVVYAYFCSTLEQVFADDLTAARMKEGAEFDALAAARRAFALDTRLAWRAISSVRRSWDLETWDLPADPA